MFSKLDIFGSQIGLNFQKDNVFKTSFGGIMSIGFIAFVGVFFWTEIISFLGKENVTSYTKKDFSIDPPTVAMNTHQFMFAIKLDHTDFLTKPLFNITWERREYTTAQNGTKIKTLYPMQFEPCREDHWTGLPTHGNVNWTQQYKDGGLQTFLCPRIEDVVRLGGSYNAYGFNFLKVQVNECINTTDPKRLWQPKCQTKEQVAAFFNKTQSVTIMFRMNNFVINPNDPKEPIKGFIEDSLFFPVQPGTAYQTADIYLTENKISTDQSILPFKDIQEEQYLVYNGGNFRLQYVIGNTNKIVADFFIRKDPIAFTHERQFTKISQMASFIGGFCQTFILIAAILVNQYNGYICTFKLANKLYDFDFGEENNPRQIDNEYASSLNKKKTLADKLKPQENCNKSISVKFNDNNKNENPLQNQQSNIPLASQSKRSSLKKQTNHKKQWSLQYKPKTREEGGLLSLEQINNLVQKQTQMISEQIQTPSSQQIPTNFFNLSQNNISPKKPEIIEQAKPTYSKEQKYQEKQQLQQFSQQLSSKIINKQNEYGNNQIEQISIIDESIQPETPNRQVKDCEDDNNRNQQQNNIENTDRQKLPSLSFQLSTRRDLMTLTGIEPSQRDSIHQKDTNKTNDQIDMYQSKQKESMFKSCQTKQSTFTNQNSTVNINTLKSGILQNKTKILSHQTNQDLLDEKSFLMKEFQFLTQRDKSIKLTWKYFFYKLTCGKFFKNKQVLLLDKAQQMMEKEMDIFMILNGIKELQKFKDLYLTKEQQILFNFFPKPVISIDENQQLPSRIEIEEKKKENNQYIKQENKKEIQELQIHQKKLNLSMNVAFLVKKASAKLKQSLHENTNKKISHNIDQYLKLYEAFNQVSLDDKSEINQRLIKQLGQEMNKIFEISKNIKKNKQRLLNKSKLYKKQTLNKEENQRQTIDNNTHVDLDYPRNANPTIYLNEKDIQELRTTQFYNEDTQNNYNKDNQQTNNIFISQTNVPLSYENNIQQNNNDNKNLLSPTQQAINIGGSIHNIHNINNQINDIENQQNTNLILFEEHHLSDDEQSNNPN